MEQIFLSLTRQQIERVHEDGVEETTRREDRNSQPVGPTTTTSPNMPNPRLGGGTDENTWWTGGSNLEPRTRKASILASRPNNVKVMLDIEKQIRNWIQDEYRLGLPTEKIYKVSLTKWIKTVKDLVEKKWARFGLQNIQFYLVNFCSVSTGCEEFGPFDWPQRKALS
jgi:hypothetical protein